MKKFLLLLILPIFIHLNFNTTQKNQLELFIIPSFFGISIKLFIDNNFIYFKLFSIIVISLILLYFKLFFVILDRFVNTKKEPTIPKYIPSFIKNFFISIYDVSIMENSEREILTEYMKRTMLMITIMYLSLILICLNT